LIGRPWSLRRRAVLIRWLTIALAVAVWQLVTGGAHGSYFAAPSEIVTTGGSYLVSSEALHGLATTAQEFLLAFVIAAVAGITIGVVFGLSRRTAPVAGDAAYLLYTLPQVPLYPLFVVALGIGRPAEIAFGVSHGVVPIVLTVVAATARVDQQLLTAARSMGASRLTTIRTFILPAIVPELVTALRVGASLSLIGVVIGQVLVSVDGVGVLITQLVGTLQAAKLDAVVLAVCIAAIVVNVGLRAVERRLSRWRTAG
jgi:NitT/TauT family transport system permease protein